MLVVGLHAKTQVIIDLPVVGQHVMVRLHQVQIFVGVLAVQFHKIHWQLFNAAVQTVGKSQALSGGELIFKSQARLNGIAVIQQKYQGINTGIQGQLG